jgi:eukaryotic-like serine/threonine-protein kinase
VTTLSRTEESRSLLQKRLALLYGVAFALSAAFLIAILTFRGLVGEGVMAELRSPSRWFHTAAVALTGLLWWFLRRGTLSFALLEVVDAGGVLSLALCLNLNAGLFEIRTVAVFNLVLTSGVALVLRAIVVPSTARRTLLLGLVAGAIAVTIFLASALHPAWPVTQRGAADWPIEFQLISLTLWLGVLVVIATVASRVIYDLRREVRSALRLGQYVLSDKIGEGGMGVVYRATHAMLRRETALKLLPANRVDATALRRFEREVVHTARLHHPNTVAIFDYGRTLDGVFYYAMEYLQGLTLGQLVEREGPLSPGRVVWLLSQVCASLEEAHAAGLVHRDIKPSNIMVVGNPAAYDLVKVLDFGLVKTLATASPSASRTNNDVIVGTPLYLAPEAISDPDSVDGRSDLYAVAAVGYFLLSGSNVFEGASLVEICAAHLHSQPAPLRERLGRAVPEDLEALLLSGLAKAPVRRPQTAAAFREALLSCDVPAWTEQDAREWWRRYHSDESPASESAPDLSGATIPVMRMPDSPT